MTRQSLTQDQKDTAEQFQDFLLDETEQFMIISGKAGTGKTYLMNHLATKGMARFADHCDLMGIDNPIKEVQYTATTNKAAEVLEGFLGESVSTLHSFLRLMVTPDKDSANTNLVQREHKTTNRHLVFVDEASMVDEDLLRLLFQALDRQSKVVFVGDHLQLLPVNSETSPVFDDIKTPYRSYLEEQVRNAEVPELMALCDQMRDIVDTGIFTNMEEVPGIIEYLSPDEMEDAVYDAFVENPINTRILCYTNTRVQAFNQAIRELKELPAHFTVGEELVCATANHSFAQPIQTERLYKIVELQDAETYDQAEQFLPDGMVLSYRNYRIAPSHNPLQEFVVPIADDADLLKTALNTMKRKKAFQTYWGLRNFVADLRPSAACTVYKAQGSTYDTAFLDIGNIGTCHDPEQVARMLFVGVSRAAKRVFLFGNLPNRYLQRRGTRRVA